jgi:hypothetical protein
MKRRSTVSAEIIMSLLHFDREITPEEILEVENQLNTYVPIIRAGSSSIMLRFHFKDIIKREEVSNDICESNYS